MNTIVIIGASADRSKFGNKAVRAYLTQGWTVYPVHPTAGEIEGIEAYRSIRDVPRPSLDASHKGQVDRVSMYLPSEKTLALLDDIAAAEPAEFWLNPGSESDELIAAAEQRGLNVIVACSIVDIGESPSDYA